MGSSGIVERRAGSWERRLLCPMKFGNPSLGDLLCCEGQEGSATKAASMLQTVLDSG